MTDSSLLPFLVSTAVVGVSVAIYLRRNHTYKHCVGNNPSIGQGSSLLRLCYLFLYMVVLVGLPIGFFAESPRWLDLHDWLPLEWLGTVIVVAGVALFVAAIRALGENYSPNYDSRMPNKIVTRGPYRYLRHPIYVSNVISILGVGAATGVTPVFAAALVLAWTYYVSARAEDAALVSMRKAEEEG